ncbi:uncharacterized protein LOC34619245 [Cyclospora cayetanensis]|uniref:Uncharacterized protein LOC34619245 n=1 Tax=Cyclospora cayetanensis TaxID=88456 RepID=A0A6P6RW27_9EIME|nr:uncharacterized protein LOC34619245 [Cyclospora cayetanensis]
MFKFFQVLEDSTAKASDPFRGGESRDLQKCWSSGIFSAEDTVDRIFGLPWAIAFTASCPGCSVDVSGATESPPETTANRHIEDAFKGKNPRLEKNFSAFSARHLCTETFEEVSEAEAGLEIQGHCRFYTHLMTEPSNLPLPSMLMGFPLLILRPDIRPDGTCCWGKAGSEMHLTALILASVAFLILFKALVAHASSTWAPAPVPASGSFPASSPLTPKSIEGTVDTLSSSTLFSEVSKRLLDLNSCISDVQCWGRGRRCIDGRCWGFAGPRHDPFRCEAGTVCALDRVDGHFYGEGGRGSVGRFLLQPIQGSLEDCGSDRGVLHKPHILCEGTSPGCDLTEAGHQNGVPAEDTFQLGAPVECTYTPGITTQSSCSARLGFVPPSLPVGRYALCGCSSTDLGGNGRVCSSIEDFSAPVGVLLITGFAAPAASIASPRDSEIAKKAGLESQAKPAHIEADSTTQEDTQLAAESSEGIIETDPIQVVPSSVTQQHLLLPRFSCTADLPCELPGIKGFGLNSKDHFVRAISGIHSSCQGTAKASSKHTSTPLRLPCNAVSRGSRCVVRVHQEDMKALLQSTGPATRTEDGGNRVVDATLCGCRRGSTLLDCVGGTVVGLLQLKAVEGKQQHQQQRQLRKLQFIEGRAANLPEEENEFTPVGNECQKHADCLRGYGSCVSGRCRGFIPDLKGDRLIRCVEGYYCDAGAGDIPTRGNKENFTVIGIGPDEECGAAVNLKADNSIFNNANKWVCSSSVSSSCELRFGVARRVSRANTVEGVRLCGCPGVDLNGDNSPCNHMRDFRVPLGRVSVQECITNAHCADRQLAYCIKDHCGDFLVSAAAASVNAFACVRNQDCTIENVTARSVSEALKVIPIAAHLKCGPDAALDPNFLPESAMPCVADVDGDGKCDVHLGVNHFFGTHRLCGCSGGDCDDPSDFGVELGLLNTVECVVHSDCPIHSLCAKGECIADDMPPVLVASEPAAGSMFIPPLRQIELQFNEDIAFGRPGASLVVACLDPDIKWVVTLPDGIHELQTIRYNPALYPRAPKRAATADATAEQSRSENSKWVLERQGQVLTVTPDDDLPSLPQGEYTVSLDFGFATDLTGNPSEGVPSLKFTLARDAGCPLLYVTGLATENGNANGLYTPIEPINKHAAWRGAEGNAFFIYFRKETEGEPGNWVVDTDLDETAFLGFADVSLLAGKITSSSESDAIPPTGLWHKWTGKKREEQPFTTFICRDTPDHLPPTLTDARATQRNAPGGGGGPHPLKLNSDTGAPESPITLVFNKPVNYGHWASLRLVPRGGGAPVAEWITDQEAGMRGEGGTVMIRSAPPPARTPKKATSASAEGMQGDSEEPKQQPGIVELTVEAPLEGGKEYDLIADLGAFTDFSYNPWGPLAPQTVSFVAVATHCSLRVGAAAVAAAAESAEPDGPEAQATAGDEGSYELVIAPSGSYAEGDTRAGEGAIAVVRCTEGLAVPSDLVEGADVRNAGMVRCRNGRWDGHLTPCVPRCGPYPSLPEAYEVEEKEEGAAEGLLGASIVIRCTEAAAAGEGEKPQEQTLRCAGGRWEPLKLSCAALCPPLGPSLGHQYSVLLPDGSEPRAAGQGDVEAAAIEGDKRVVSCRDAGVATEQHMEEAEHEQLRQVVQCTEKGWAPPLSFSCNRSCLQPPVPPEGADIQGESLRHGSVWTATCKSGYENSHGMHSVAFTCTDGQWLRQVPAWAPSFSCMPLCAPLVLDPRAYTLTPIASEADTGTKAETAVKIACAKHGVLLGGPPEEILRCEGGLWSLRSTTCAASCRNPMDVLGSDYTLSQQEQQQPQKQTYAHGETAQIKCSGINSNHSPAAAAAAAAAAARAPPHTITCIDGSWESKPQTPMHQKHQLESNDSTALNSNGSNRGGGVLLRCTATCGLPPLPAHFAVLSSTGKGSHRQLRNKLYRGGEKLLIGCSAPFDATLNMPSELRQERLQRQQQQLQCADGEWVGELKDEVCVRQCPGNPGDLPESKWRELGVVCGASCGSGCGSCYNSKKDREEEGVDCGGPFCVPCSNCSPLPLKQFLLQPRLYATSLAHAQHRQQQQQQQQHVEFPLEMTKHGSRIGVSCISNPALSLRVTCSNGRWVAGSTTAAAAALASVQDDATRLAAFAASCVHADLGAPEIASITGTEDATRPRAMRAALNAAAQTEDSDALLSGASAAVETAAAEAGGGAPPASTPLQWREPELLRFGPPVLRLPMEHDAPLFRQQQQQQQPLSPCMEDLVKAVSKLLVGECGALAFGSTPFKVASFCKGTCSTSFKRELQVAAECSSRAAAAIAAAAPGPATTATSAPDEHLLQTFHQMLDVFCEVKDGDHCFSNAAETFDFLQRLHQTRQLQQLLQQHVCPGSRGSACFSSNIRYIAVLQELRQHMDVVMPGLQQTQQQLPPLSTLGGNEAKGPEEGLLGFGVRGLLTDLRRLPAIASLLCTAVDGQSCASQVLAVGSVNPFAPLPPPEAAAGFCSSSPEAPCLLEVYRLLGKELLQPHDAETQPQKEESREQRLLRQQVHPFDWALGTTLLSIGRNFCLRSAEDQICGALLLSPDVTEPVIAAFGALVMRPYEPVAQADLPYCMCPLAFVGDGECDRSCNTAACAFDRGDCLAQQQPLLQPILESLEAATVHRADSCFPFLKGFDCSNNECKQAMRELQARHGCCLAPQLELLRDLLSIDAYQQQQQRLQLVRLQQQAPEAVTPQLLRLVDSLWNEAGSEGPPMEYYRSIAFFEGDCKMAFDRTCSRGLNRFVFSVEATLEGLDYDSLSSGIGSNTEELLRHVLRDTLSGAFGVPLGDVLLVRAWRGLDIHAILDAGPLSNKSHFLQAIEVLRSDGSSGLSELLSTALQRQHAGATAAYPRQRRLQEQPLSALQKQQHVWEALVLHPVPLLLPEPLFTSSAVSVRPSSVSITQVAFASPGTSSSVSGSRRQQMLQQLRPERGTWGLGRVVPRDVACNTNNGLSAPPNVSVFEAYRLHSTLTTNNHGAVISVECGHGYAPIEGRSPQELVCQQGRWVPLEKEANLPSSPEDLSTRILRCRKPCGAYEAFDPLVLGPAFVASGLGEADGDHRVVYCASGFVAASDTMPRTETVVCSNGTWSKRQLECVKDFAAIAETSPCAASLSRLPPTLKVESLPTTATQHGSSSATPPINSDVAAALATTFQRAGVSLQLFRIGCARGFVSTVLQQQQPLSPKQQQQPFAYAACKDGRLLDLGPEDPLPMGAFASGEAAGALAQQLKLRVDSSPEAVTAYEAVTVAGSGAPAKQAFLLDGSLGAEATNRIAAEAQQQILKGRRLQDPTPLYLGAWLGCQRELRQEPHKAPKPVSDTLLVFSSLLLLFVLVVGVLAFWWFRSHRKEKKAAKLQQQDGGDYSRQTISDLRGGLSPSELEGPPGIDVGSSAENYGGGSLQSHQFLQREGISSLAAPIFSTGLSGGPLPYLRDGGLLLPQQQQQQRQRQRAATPPPAFPSEDTAGTGVAAASGAPPADEHSLAFYAPVYYAGLSRDGGHLRQDRGSSSSGGGGGCGGGGGASEEDRMSAHSDLLLPQHQQQQRHLLQQQAAAASTSARRAELGPADTFRIRGNSPAAVSAAYIAAAAAAATEQHHVYPAGVPSAGHATQQVMVRRGSLPAYAEGEDRKQQQQPRTERSMSQRFKALTEEAPAVLGDSGVTSAGISLTDDEELYPEDSASCVAMTAGQRQATTTAAASSRGRPSRIPKNKGASMTHYPSSQGHGGKASQPIPPQATADHMLSGTPVYNEPAPVCIPRPAPGQQSQALARQSYSRLYGDRASRTYNSLVCWGCSWLKALAREEWTPGEQEHTRILPFASGALEIPCIVPSLPRPPVLQGPFKGSEDHFLFLLPAAFFLLGRFSGATSIGGTTPISDAPGGKHTEFQRQKCARGNPAADAGPQSLPLPLSMRPPSGEGVESLSRIGNFPVG